MACTNNACSNPECKCDPCECTPESLCECCESEE